MARQLLFSFLLILHALYLASCIGFNDPMFDQMWYYNGSNPMNIRRVWKEDRLTGSGSMITVLDDSVDVLIPELAPAVSAQHSYDYVRRSSRLVYRFGENHGTKMAGIALGRANNNVCGLGVAYEATLAAVRAFSLRRGISVAREVKSLVDRGRHLATDVFIFGWGAPDNGETLSGPSSLPAAAMEKASLEGKDGVGSVLMIGAGNGGDDDDCQFDGYAASRYTITVQAVSETSTKSWYAEHCTAAMTAAYIGPGLVAPSSTFTAGEGQCLDDVEGTAAAASVVAGIVALVREKEPTLSRRTIQHMLVEASNPEPVQHNEGWVTNGAGHSYHHHFGFGVIDAKKFVDLSDEPSLQFPNDREASCGPLNLIPTSLNGSEAQFDSEQCVEAISSIEHVTVSLTFSATRRGEVEVFLTSPAGTTIKLLSKRPKDTARHLDNWKLTTPAFWDEAAGGIWTLQMRSTEGVQIEDGWSADLRIFGVEAFDVVESDGGN